MKKFLFVLLAVSILTSCGGSKKRELNALYNQLEYEIQQKRSLERELNQPDSKEVDDYLSTLAGRPVTKEEGTLNQLNFVNESIEDIELEIERVKNK